MTTPTTPPVDLQAIEAVERYKAVVTHHPHFVDRSYAVMTLDDRGDYVQHAHYESLLSLIREKDQVIERLERERGIDWHFIADSRSAEIVRLTAELATLKAGQEARELALIEYIIAWMNGDVEWPENNGAALAAFNATHSGEKMK